jgi:hypothetical protein
MFLAGFDGFLPGSTDINVLLVLPELSQPEGLEI